VAPDTIQLRNQPLSRVLALGIAGPCRRLGGAGRRIGALQLRRIDKPRHPRFGLAQRRGAGRVDADPLHRLADQATGASFEPQ
jgi:hypothetical protein